MIDIYDYLKQHAITYKRFDHAPVFSAQEIHHLPPMPGADIKNLFLREKGKDNYFLVVVPGAKRIDFKQLSKDIDVKSLTFGKSDAMQRILGVEPGSVTLLGLVHDKAHEITVFIDEELRDKPLQCHPLKNTSTLVIDFSMIEKFLILTGHQLHFTSLRAA